MLQPKRQGILLLCCAGLAFCLALAGSANASPLAAQAPATPAAPVQPRVYLPAVQQGAPAASTPSPAALSTPLLIEQAALRGEITETERVLYLAYALYEPQLLPPQFQSHVGWRGTQYVLEVQNALPALEAAASDAVQQELGRLRILAATVCDEADNANSSDSANFHFNYGAISGGLSLDSYSASLEQTFAVEVTGFGWARPPLCTGGATCGGVANPFGRYPVQIADLGMGLYGYVSDGGGNYTGLIGDNPNTAAIETAASASCMVLNQNFSVFPEGAQAALDATTAHEFVHSIQFGYGDPSPLEDEMWFESSASAMEDDVFDSSNSNHIYLWPVVSNSLGEWPNGSAPNSLSQYSNFLFFRHVAEHNGGANTPGGGEEVLQRFWENVAAGQGQLVAYNNALVTAGTNLPDAFHRYAIAARFSKSCGGGYVAPYCFEEGGAYVTAAGGLASVQGSIAANPGSYNGSIRNHYAANWVNLPTSGSPYKVTLTNTAAGGQLRGSLVCDTGSALTVTAFPAVVSAGANTSIDSFSAAGCTRVTAVITNQEQTSANPGSAPLQNYTLAVSAAGETPTPTPSATPTAMPTATPTSSATPTAMPTTTPTSSATPTAMPTATPTSSATPTAMPTATPTSSATPAAMPTATPTPSATPTGTATASITPSATPGTPAATATATATSTPAGPRARADTAVTVQNAAVLIDVLANDQPGADLALAVTGVTQPAGGLTVIEQNKVRYTPAQAFTGSTFFTYTVGDGGGLSSSARVAVVVGPASDAAGPPQGLPVPDPAVTTTLTTTTNSGAASIVLPAGAVTNSLSGATYDLVFTEVITPAQPLTDVAYAGRAFVLQLFVDAQPQAGYVFAQPILITLPYDPALFPDPSRLALFYYDERSGRWSDDGIRILEVNPQARTFTASLAHLSEFAAGVRAKAPNSLYLPVLSR